MKRKTFSLKYMLLTYRLDMLWLPAAFWSLFTVMAWILRREPMGFNITTAFLGAALPLISGILAAYAILDDPALELQFTTPRPAWLMLLERLGMIFVISGLCALSYQVIVPLFAIDLSPLGSPLARQLAWLAPTLAMMALGASSAFAARQGMTGAAVVGLVWIFEIILREWFLQDRWAQYLLIMMGSNYPDHPALRGNQATLLALAALLLVGAWALLRRQERYI